MSDDPSRTEDMRMPPTPRCLHEQRLDTCPACRRKARAEQRQAIATWMHVHPELVSRRPPDEEAAQLPLRKKRP